MFSVHVNISISLFRLSCKEVVHVLQLRSEFAKINLSRAELLYMHVGWETINK
jgi:hypothetical protein